MIFRSGIRGIRVLFACLVTVAGTSAARADNALWLTPGEVISRADVIARVRVFSTAPRPDISERIMSARLYVVETFKGVGWRPGDERELVFDYWSVCPGVQFEAGEDCIVFLVKDKDGRYQTVNYEQGKRTLQLRGDYRRFVAPLRVALGGRTPLLLPEDAGEGILLPRDALESAMAQWAAIGSNTVKTRTADTPAAFSLL
jgi:hypothetical protein